MKTSPLLTWFVWITLIALTVTTLYAQTTTGNSVISKMKAAVSAFTLAGDLNPGQTGLQSAPVSGKKTGDMLTAGEWNRVLELVSEGGSGDGSGWVDVPLTGTENFDSSCFYRFKTQLTNKQYVWTAPYYYVNAVAPTKLTWQFGNFTPEETWNISASSKNVLLLNNTPYTGTSGNVTKIEKLCGGGSGGSGGSVNYLQLTTPASVTFAEGGKVPFTTVVSQKGSQITQNGGEITLKGGSSYRISSDLRLTSPNSGIWYTIVDKTSWTGVGVFGANYTGTYTGSWGGTSALALVSPTVDTTYFIKTSSLSWGPYSTSSAGHFTVEELGGGGSGSSSPAYYRCSDAQSANISNWPCYWASRNGGHGDGRYLALACISGHAGNKYISTDWLKYDNGWKIWANDTTGYVTCAGNVLVADTQASGGGSGSGWVDVPLTDTADFDTSCEYRAYVPKNAKQTENSWQYFISVTPKKLTSAPSNDSQIYIPNTDKKAFYITPYGRADAWGLLVTKIEKRCN
jgi:hypothetical protein